MAQPKINQSLLMRCCRVSLYTLCDPRVHPPKPFLIDFRDTSQASKCHGKRDMITITDVAGIEEGVPAIAATLGDLGRKPRYDCMKQGRIHGTRCA